MTNQVARTTTLALSEDVAFVRRLARSLLRDRDLADDVAQDALTAALEHPPAPERRRGWLTGVVRNQARSRVRAQRRRREIETRVAEERELRSSTVDASELLERQQDLVRAVAELDTAQREAIVMRYFEGCSTSAIARRQGISAAAARKRVSRALSTLRARLERKYGDESGGWVRALTPLAIGKRLWLAPSWLLAAKWSVAGLALVAGVLLSVRWLGGADASEVAPRGDGGATSVEPIALAPDADRHDESRASATDSIATTRDAIDSPSASGSPTFVQVIDANTREVLPAARLWLDHGEGPVAVESESNTRFELSDLPDGAHLVASAAGRLSAWIEVTPEHLALEQIELALERGASVRGRAYFEGGAIPDVPAFELRTAASAPRSDWPESLASALHDELHWYTAYPVPIDADGEFRVDGLPLDWHGRLWARPEFQFDRVEPNVDFVFYSVELDKPYGDLELHLLRPPLVRGRLQWSNASDEPVKGRVELAVLFQDGTKSFRDPLPIDREGRFSKALVSYADPYARAPVESVRLVAYPEGGALREVVLDDFPEGGSIDLGTIVVDRAQDLHFVVVDSRGEPIEDAVVAGEIPRDYGHLPGHARAGDDGSGVLRSLPAERDIVHVGASGFTSRYVKLDGVRGSIDRPREFVLEPTPVLEIVAAARPELAESLRLEVRHSAPLFAASNGAPPAGSDVEQLERFRSIVHDGWQQDVGIRRFSATFDARWQLSNLTPGLELELRLLNPMGDVVGRGTTRTPSSAGVKRVELELLAGSAHYFGRVVGTDGRGLTGVRIVLPAEESLGAQVIDCDSSGRFDFYRFEPTQGAQPIKFLGAGFVARELSVDPVLTDNDLGDVVLEAARTVIVRVLDSNRRDVQVQETWGLLDDGRRFDGSRMSRRLSIRGLPFERGEIHARVGFRTYRAPIDPAQRSIELDVPPHGRFEYSVRGAEAKYVRDSDAFVRVSPSSGASAHLSMRADQPWSLDLLPGDYRLELGDAVELRRVEAGRTVGFEFPNGSEVTAGD